MRRSTILPALWPARFGRLAGGAAAAMVLALASAGPAAANGLPYPLPSGSTYVFGTPNPPQTNTFNPVFNYWSVVSISVAPTTAPGQVAESYNLSVNDPSGRSLATVNSTWPYDGVVAVNLNSGHAPAGTYQAVTSVGAGSGSYDMEFSSPHRVLYSTLPNVKQSIPMGPGEIVTTSDVWLNAGQVYSFQGWGCSSGCWGRFMLMPPDLSVATSAQAVATLYFQDGGGTDLLNWTAPRGGWYGLILVTDQRASSDTPYMYINGRV